MNNLFDMRNVRKYIYQEETEDCELTNETPYLIVNNIPEYDTKLIH